MNIIPKPRQIIELQRGSWKLPDCLSVTLDGFQPWCVQVFAKRMGIQIQETEEHRGNLCIISDKQKEKEEYCLTIGTDGIAITAATEQGVIQALTTVCRLAEQGRLAFCEIKDKPQYGYRGLNFDCARHFWEISEVKKIIEQLSLAKINVLHWHLSDDQGWRIESKIYPKLHETSGKYYTQEQIRDVVSFAKERGMEVIPEIDMPGHVTAMVAAYPELSCREERVEVATSMGIYSDILCAGKEDVYTFLENLLDEICPLFESDRFHIGGDEAPKIRWRECSHCRKRMEQLGLSNHNDLQGAFSGRIADILKKHGKQAITWNDNLRAGNLPKDILAEFWSLQYNQQSESFAKKGGQWIYSDMFELYLDYPYSMTSVKKVYETTPHFGSIPVPKGGEALGMEAAIWCEHITSAETLERRLFPRIYALAENAWSGTGDYADFCTRLEAEQHRMEDAGINCTARSWWDPEGKARRKEAIAYMKNMNGSMSKEKKAETVEATKPSPEFAQAFINQFFKKSDLLFLLPVMLKK